MATMLHRHLGMMDGDSPDTVVPKGAHRTARNGIFRGVPGNYRYEVAPGTTLRSNPLLPGTGVNVNIKSYYDSNNAQLYSFNRNSLGAHGIYIFNTIAKTWVRLIENGVNTVGNPLKFTGARISDVDIIYGDGVSGNLLFFRDSLTQPRKLNIQRLLAGGYTGIQDTFLDVIKAPPVGLPKCSYENDTTVSANNLVNSIFNVALTHLYDDFEESVLGSGAVQPLPSDPFDPKNNTPASRNSRIAIYVPTGDQNVTKIRIYGKQTTNGVTTDWFIIDTLIKADLGISNNTYYRYLFFNNGNYVTADPKFTVADQDFVPLFAGAQALLNGSVISYGNITEGYDFINPTFNITTGNTDAPVYNVNGTLFFAATNGLFTTGQPQLKVTLTGVGVNDGFGNPTTLEKPPGLMVVKAKSNGADVSFQYLNIGPSTSIPTLLNNLQAAAVTAGWVVDTSTPNSFTVHYPTGTVILQSSFIQGAIGGFSPYNSSICALYPQSAYSWGVVYRDGGGRTNGVISNVTGNIKTQTQGTAGQMPIVTIDMSGFVPPAWAVYYEIVRTDTLTYLRHFDWISNSAYSNIGTASQTQYAYFGLANVDYYNTQQNATQGVVGYTQFTPGDRIKILGRYDINNVFTPLNFDYAIVGLAVNPNVNGIVKPGNFVQITYPTSDINANFAFDGTINFQNYRILIYSYKAQAATNQNVYFQTGQQYGIGNPGLNTAYHMGNIADNQVAITDGDVFFRPRTVPIIDKYIIPSIGYDQGSTWGTLRINVNGGGTVLDPTLLVNNGLYEIKGGSNQAGGQGVFDYPSDADNDYTFKNLSGSISLTVRLKGTQPITDKVDPHGIFAMWVKVNTPGVAQNNIIIVNQPGLEKDVLHNFDFDATIIVPPGGKLWLQNFAVNELIVGGFPLELDVIRTETINIFDSSFSDIYAIRTNSDNKPNVVDTTARKTTFNTLFRFSVPDVLGTNINNSNRFYFNNFDEFSKEFGPIMKMRVRQRELRIFQYRRCGQVGIYQKFIKDNSGVNQLVTTDTIITPNNIRYFEGEYGIGNQPDSLCSSGYVDYFADPVKGFWCRLSLNGIEPISELYKTQTFSGTNFPNYLSNYAYPFGGNSVILSAFNFNKDRDGEAILVLQPGTSGPTTLIGEALAFNETKNAFTALFDWNIDSIVCCENLLYFFRNGQLYSWDNDAAPNNFFGTVYPATITIPFNDSLMEKKTFLSLSEVSDVIWECPLIYTDQMSYPGQRQESNLVAEDFALLGNEFNASFWRDQHGQKGQFNGSETLKGSLVVIQFQVTNPTNLSSITDISVNFIESHRNNR
jgi:hypothetical protein